MEESCLIFGDRDNKGAGCDVKIMMTDVMTPEQRHHCMSSIRSRDTRPEVTVRRYLWQHGYRYRLYKKELPGRPDIVLSRLRTVIFINGCFWHGHECHRRFPKTNRDFWLRKIERNRERDRDVAARLRQMGWNVITIWECELAKARRDETLERLITTLRAFETEPKAPSPYSFPEADTELAAEAELEWGE